MKGQCMNHRTRTIIISVVALCVVVLCMSLAQRKVSAQNDPTKHDEKEPAVPIYNPYPAGILPSDLNSELARVLREVDVIENRALAEWHALPPLTFTGQPPTLQGTGYQAVQILGKLMNYDVTMSPFRNEFCAFCHMPYVAFSGPIPSVNLTMIAYPGSAHFRAGKRQAQQYTYSNRFPVLR